MNGGDGCVKDKAVPLLSGAPPRVRERDHGDSHAADLDETYEESKWACCLKWVKLGSGRAGPGCPFYPQEQTPSGQPDMSEKCQKRTSSVAQAPEMFPLIPSTLRLPIGRDCCSSYALIRRPSFMTAVRFSPPFEVRVMAEMPEAHYVKSDDVHIAYQVSAGMPICPIPICHDCGWG